MKGRDPREYFAEIQDHYKILLRAYIDRTLNSTQIVEKLLEHGARLDSFQGYLCEHHDPSLGIEAMIESDARDKAAGRAPGYGGVE